MNDRADVSATLENSPFFMPFSMNRQFKKHPRLLARAEGMYYYTPEGRKILDGTAGLWCVNAGHCRKKIVDAVARGVATLDFAPPFNMGHPLAFEFAERIAPLLQGGFDTLLDLVDARAGRRAFFRRQPAQILKQYGEAALLA